MCHNSGDPVQDCQHYLRRVDDDIQKSFHPTRPVQPLLAARSLAVDTVLQHMWNRHFADRQDLTLAAVGGYGRGELYPFSDIDLLILVTETPDQPTATALGEVLRNLWDMHPRHTPRLPTSDANWSEGAGAGGYLSLLLVPADMLAREHA